MTDERTDRQTDRRTWLRRMKHSAIACNKIDGTVLVQQEQYKQRDGASDLILTCPCYNNNNYIAAQHASADTIIMVRAMNVKYRKWRLGGGVL